jgi:hypothetical protein
VGSSIYNRDCDDSDDSESESDFWLIKRTKSIKNFNI